MPSIPEFVEGLERHIALHKKKNDDYANEGKEFYNFEYTAQQMFHFEHCDPVVKSFLYLIFTKMARFAILTIPGKVPNNESLIDTLDDWEIYVGLMRAYIERMSKIEK